MIKKASAIRQAESAALMEEIKKLMEEIRVIEAEEEQEPHNRKK
jgi:hypothetical protein